MAPVSWCPRLARGPGLRGSGRCGLGRGAGRSVCRHHLPDCSPTLHRGPHCPGLLNPAESDLPWKGQPAAPPQEAASPGSSGQTPFLCSHEPNSGQQPLGGSGDRGPRECARPQLTGLPAAPSPPRSPFQQQSNECSTEKVEIETGKEGLRQGSGMQAALF